MRMFFAAEWHDRAERIHVTGTVDDVGPYYERAQVAVVPLRAGGGSRLKILEAFALGRPVVSTTLGAEGLDVVDGEHLLLADTAAAFAEAVIRLLEDPELSARIAGAARALVEERYDWDTVAELQREIYRATIHVRRTPDV